MPAHWRLAIRAAVRGNWKPADTLELAHLRQFVSPHEADGEQFAYLHLAPEEIRRSCGPRGEDVAVWRFDLPCPQCGASGERDIPDFMGEDVQFCRRCEGEGIDLEERGELLTTLDGLILEDNLP